MVWKIFFGALPVSALHTPMLNPPLEIVLFNAHRIQFTSEAPGDTQARNALVHGKPGKEIMLAIMPPTMFER
jgi:hypothetical protein